MHGRKEIFELADICNTLSRPANFDGLYGRAKTRS